MNDFDADRKEGSGNSPRDASGSRGRKVLVILLCLLGPIVGLTMLLTARPAYESEAMLLIRYLVERSAGDSHEVTKDLSEDSAQVLATEVEILTSRDVAKRVAESIGPEEILPGIGETEDQPTADEAAAVVTSGLQAEANPESRTLRLRFRHADREVAVEVLKNLIHAYFERHLEIHRRTDQLDEISKQTDKARIRLDNTDKELNQYRAMLGADPEPKAALDLRGRIEALEHRRDLERKQYHKLQGLLEVAYTDALLDPSRMPNIAIIQQPSLPVAVRDDATFTRATLIAAIGPLLGLLVGMIPSGRRGRAAG